ncbi:MAG: hypothetical protein QXV23_02735 [Candidatus Bathyarchaeia archaeon]
MRKVWEAQVFSSRCENWESKVKPILKKAFAGWHHKNVNEFMISQAVISIVTNCFPRAVT